MDKIYDLVIIGGASAGFSAGIYAARSGLDAIILEQGMGGGQAATSPWIENYPGYEGISGMDLMVKMKEHAEKNLPVEVGVHVESVSQSDGIFTVKAGSRTFQSKSIILATGSKYKKIGVPGEGRLMGSGVSYCATCDGMFFRGKKVAVIGGGNNGVTEAIHLKHVGADVTLVHRRNELRAEQILQEQLDTEGINKLLNVDTLEIMGDNMVTGIRVLNKSTGKEEVHDFQGVFISVGEEPSTELAIQLGVELRENGYVKVDRKMRTNVRMVYAAGDLTGGLRQVITAASEGAIAAMSAYDDVKRPYWA